MNSKNLDGVYFKDYEMNYMSGEHMNATQKRSLSGKRC